MTLDTFGDVWSVVNWPREKAGGTAADRARTGRKCWAEKEAN